MVEDEKDAQKKLGYAYFTRDEPYVKEHFLAKDYTKAATTGIGQLDRFFGFLWEMDFPILFDFRPDQAPGI